MSDLVRLLGRDNVEILSRAAGGQRLVIPKHYGKPPGGGHDSSKRLKALVGEPLAILLVFHFGDSVIYVPTGRASKWPHPVPIDKKQLRLLKRRGLSVRAIAAELGCTVRTVEKHEARRQATEAARKRTRARNAEKVPMQGSDPKTRQNRRKSRVDCVIDTKPERKEPRT